MALSQPRSQYRIDEGPDSLKKAHVAADADDISETDVQAIPDDAHAQQRGSLHGVSARVHKRTSSLMSRLVGPLNQAECKASMEPPAPRTRRTRMSQQSRPARTRSSGAACTV